MLVLVKLGRVWMSRQSSKLQAVRLIVIIGDCFGYGVLASNIK